LQGSAAQRARETAEEEATPQYRTGQWRNGLLPVLQYQNESPSRETSRQSWPERLRGKHHPRKLSSRAQVPFQRDSVSVRPMIAPPPVRECVSYRKVFNHK